MSELCELLNGEHRLGELWNVEQELGELNELWNYEYEMDELGELGFGTINKNSTVEESSNFIFFK